jgi:hypothetical protein
MEPNTFTTPASLWRSYEIAAYNVSLNSGRSCLDATVENVDNLMNLGCPVTPAVHHHRSGFSCSRESLAAAYEPGDCDLDRCLISQNQSADEMTGDSQKQFVLESQTSQKL